MSKPTHRCIWCNGELRMAANHSGNDGAGGCIASCSGTFEHVDLEKKCPRRGRDTTHVQALPLRRDLPA